MGIFVKIENRDTGHSERVTIADIRSSLSDIFGEKFYSSVVVSGKDQSLSSPSSPYVVTCPNGDFNEHTKDILEVIGAERADRNNENYRDEELYILNQLNNRIIKSAYNLGMTQNQFLALALSVPLGDFADVSNNRVFNVEQFMGNHNKLKYKNSFESESMKNDDTLSSITNSILDIPQKEGRYFPMGTVSRKNVDIFMSEDMLVFIDRDKSAESIEDLNQRPLVKLNSLAMAISQDYEPPGVVGYSDSVSTQSVVYASEPEAIKKTEKQFLNNESNSIHVGVLKLGDKTNSLDNPAPMFDSTIWNSEVIPNIAPGLFMIGEYAAPYKSKNQDDEAMIVKVDSKVIEKMGAGKAKSFYTRNRAGSLTQVKIGDHIRVDVNLGGTQDLIVNIDAFEKIGKSEYQKRKDDRSSDYSF